MTVFADTSALYALLVRNEDGHREVAQAFTQIIGQERPLLSTNYVLLETAALLQRRIGLSAVRDLDATIAPLLTIRWIAEPDHRRAMDRLIRADRRGLSLVDCSSFSVMEREGITEALALDSDFEAQGFRVLP